MTNPLTIIAPILGLGFVYVAVPVAFDTFRRLRGPKTVLCPETGKPEEVRVDTQHAAISSVVGRAEVEVRQCTRWGERQYCGQQCRSQLA